MRRIKLPVLLLCMAAVAVLTGCGQKQQEKKVSDIDFTVVSQKDISEDLMTHIGEKKENEFTLIYKDGEDMYLIIGYGAQQTGGYNIKVEELWLGEASVYVKTVLTGPAKGTGGAGTSYPYIVIKIENMDMPVIFDM